jgi:hypothetical protein
MSQPIPITKTKLLLGEGREEEVFFGAFLKHLGLDGQVQVISYGGKAKLRSFLGTIPLTPGFAQLVSLGITRDADDNATAAESAVRDAITAARLPETLIVRHFILPGGGRAGALEAVCLDAICATAPNTWACVESFDACLSANGTAPLSATERAKRHVQAWLSSLPTPGLRLGEAAQKGLLPFDAPAFVPLAEFLRGL